MVASKLWQKIKQFVDDKSFEIGIAAFAAILVWELMPREIKVDGSQGNAIKLTEVEWISDEVKQLNEGFNFWFVEYSGISITKQANCTMKNHMYEQEKSSYAHDIVTARYSNLCEAYGEIERQATVNAGRVISGDMPRVKDLYHFSHLKGEVERRVGPFFSLPECRYYQDLLAGIGEKVIVCGPYEIWFHDLFFPPI